MKKFFLYVALIAVAINFNGCKKESDSTLAVYGLWQVTASTQLPNLKFVDFGSSKSLTAYYETPQGFRSLIISNFSPTADQLVANFMGAYYPTAVYNYSITAGVLTIVGDNGQTLLTATKSVSSEPATWVTSVTSSDKIENLFTSNTNGIGYDGSNLLFSDYSGGKIIKVSLATRSVTDIINTVNSINTIEYDGTNYWVSRNGWDNLEKLSSTGLSLFSSTSMGSWLYGVGYVSPSSIICYSHNEDMLYNYNPSTDAVSNSKAVDGVNLGDIAISNGKVYIIQHGGNLIYRLNATTFAVEKTYRVTDAVSVYGIASVGSNAFWLNTNDGKAILKVVLD